MRLTLRTLLAYLDDVLEPSDAQALGKKIEESEFAGNLVQRIRNSVKRLRLAAPRLTGKGMGLDPNTVAEYLDNVLAADRMPEFEKVCLDSDVHLAEAAACHQILTLVLGEPAEVEHAMRERVYRIGSPTVPESDVQAAMGEEPAAAPIPVTPVADGDNGSAAAHKATPASATRQKPEVPDYLREETGVRLWPLLATLLVCFLLAGAVIVAMGPLDATHPLAPLFGFKPNPPLADAKGGTNPEGKEAPPMGDPEKNGNDMPTTPMGDPSTPATPTPMPGEVIPSTPMPMPGETALNPVPPEPMPGVIPATPATPTPGTPMPVPATPTPMPASPTDPTMPTPATPIPATPTPATPATPMPTAPMPEPAGAVKVGSYVSTDDVVLRYATADESWYRLARNAPLMAGDRLVAPPIFRPQLLLAGGVHVTLDGGTQVTLQAPDERGLPRIRVDFGRLLIAPIGMPGTQVLVQLGERTGVIAFGAADSQVAIDVRRHFVVGTDPQTAPLHRTVSVHVTGSGAVTWQEVDQKALPIPSLHALTMFDNEVGKTAPADTLPDWIAAKDQGELDKLAAATLREGLALDRPAQVVLREEASNRRWEVRSLAIRALAYLGEFNEDFKAFDDREMRSAWPAHFETLQVCLALDPTYPEKMRQGLERAAHDEGPMIYRFLWGYDPETLKVEGGKKLVDALEHPTLAVRVVAFETLRGITNQTHAYRPENTLMRNRPFVFKWREKLNSREGIEYAKPAAAPMTAPRPSPAAEPPLPDAPSPPALPIAPPALPPAPAAPTTPPLPGGPLFPAVPPR